VRPTAADEGLFEQVPFSHLLVRALDQRWTGTLFLEPPHNEVSVIQFKRGLAVRMSVPDDYAPLGQLLVDSGAIMLAEVELTLGDDGMLGEVLIERGHADRQTIRRHVAWQLLVRLVRVFGMPLATKYAFCSEYDALADQRGEPVKVDPLRVLWAGLSAHGESTVHMSAVLDPIADRQFKLRPEAKLGRFGFPDAASELLEFIRKRTTSMNELLAHRVVPEQLARRVVYLLRICRYLNITADAKPAAAERALPVPSSKRVARITLRRVTMPRGVLEELAAEQAKSSAVKRHALGDGAETGGQPPVRRAAKPDERAVAATPARRLPTPAGAPPQAPRPATTGQGTRPATPEAPAAKPANFATNAAPEPEPPAPPNPELAQQRQQLEQQLGRLSQVRAWELLELDRHTFEGGNEDEIDELLWQAYEDFSRKWHPNFCPPELAAERDGFVRLHQAGTDAYLALLDPEQRAACLARDGQKTEPET